MNDIKQNGQPRPPLSEEVKIGVYVCDCGTNIAGKIDVPELVAFARTLPHVVVARQYKYMCADPGQTLIKDDIRRLGINRVIVASCSPHLHEPTFRRATLPGISIPRRLSFSMPSFSRFACAWFKRPSICRFTRPA